MKYTVNLYKADENGFLVARACLKSALQAGGENTRDSRLLSSEMPQWNYSPLYAPVPTQELAFTKLRAADLTRCFAAAVNAINSNGLDLPTTRGLLAVNEKCYSGCFLQYLMSYPRWVNNLGKIEVGGEDYFNILGEAAEAERTATNAGLPTWKSDASQIATITKRTHNRTEALATVAPDKIHDAFAEMERQKRDGIDEVIFMFSTFVNMVGAKTSCNSVAGAVINATDRLVGLLGSCGINDFQTLDAACNAVEDELSTFGLAIAQKQDAAATVKLNDESSDQLDALKPDASKHDAREYCALIVLEAWNSGKHGGKRKSADYVFIQAKSNANLFDNIRRARTLKKKWGLATGGIMQRAAELHAMQSGGKHKKRDGLGRPETMGQAAKKSREKERKDIDAERKRRSGRKR